MRVLVEICERPLSGEVEDSYLLTNVAEVYAAKNEEIQALRGFMKEGEAVRLGRAFRKYWEQADKGLLEHGNEMVHYVHTHTSATDGRVAYCFTLLKDAGKHI